MALDVQNGIGFVKIGELADKSGFSAHTLGYYEKIG